MTGRNTRKYSNSKASKNVAVLVDSRTNQVSDLQNAIAITALGTIQEVAKRNEDYLSGVYLSKHPRLADFLRIPSNALMEVVVTDYIIATFESVSRFSVREKE